MIERLQQIMQENGMSASQFADALGVQRSGISHLLSGRNKPSLDFVLKVLERFPDVSVDWLLTGQKTPKPKIPRQTDLFTSESTPAAKPEMAKTVDDGPPQLVVRSEDPAEYMVAAKKQKTAEDKPGSVSKSAGESERVQQVILLYNDGTYDVFRKPG